MDPARPESPSEWRPLRESPWWIPPFLGRVPRDIDPTVLGTLGVAALALFFEQYDLALLTSLLPHIAENFAIAEEDLGNLLSLVRLGALGAFFLVPLADRFGRRRLFLFSIVALSVGTFATAFAQNAVQFVACQMVSRAFFLTGQALAFVIVTEELPAARRGWGIGMLAAVANIGYGLAALLYAFVEVVPFGWRALYGVGLFPLLLVPWLRRNLQETGRFAALDARRSARGGAAGLGTAWRSVVQLVRAYPGRATLISLVGGVTGVGQVSAFQFTNYHLRENLGWDPWMFFVMVSVGGGLGIIGSVIAGRLSDRTGRKAMGLLFMTVYPAGVACFYLGPGWAAAPAWIVTVFCSVAFSVILRAFSAELFPTSQRATAGGLFQLVDTLGAAGGLALLSTLMAGGLPLVQAAPMLACSVVVAGLLLLFLPETSQRELESISEESDAA